MGSEMCIRDRLYGAKFRLLAPNDDVVFYVCARLELELLALLIALALILLGGSAGPARRLLLPAAAPAGGPTSRLTAAITAVRSTARASFDVQI